MSGIIVPRRKIWTRQPQRPGLIDWSSPAVAAPVSYVIDLPLAAMHSGPGSKPISSTTWGDIGVYGFARARKFNGSSQYLDTGLKTELSGLDVTVIYAGTYPESTLSRDHPIIGSWDGTSGWLLWFDKIDSIFGRTNTISATFAIGSTISRVVAPSAAGNGAPGTPCIIGLTRKAGVLILSINGVTAHVVTNAVAPNALPKTLRINDSGHTSINYGAQSCAYASVAMTGLSEADLNLTTRNPWGIFKRRARRTIIDLGASGGALNAAASGSDTASGSATLAAQVALAGVGVSVAGGSAQAGVAVPLSAAGITVAGGSANGTATVSITAAGLAHAAGQAGLSASVLLAAAGAAQASGNATLAAQLNALASGAAQASGSANLSGGAPGALSASGGDVASGSAVLSVSVQLQATGAGQAGGSANGTASAPGALSATGQANAGGFATWSALVTLTAAGFVQAMGAGSFTATIPLQAAGSAQASGVAQASLGGLVNRFALQAREKRLTEAAASVWRASLLETDVARLTRLVHEVKHV